MADDVFGIVGTTQAGNFHVEQVVAEGGFGVVYRAIHAGFRAPVALKCLKVSEAKTPRERQLFLAKFREEAQLLFRLSASIPEVVRPLHVDVLHLGNGEFVPFLALEWLDGESLDRVIDRRRMRGEAPIPLHKLMKLMRPIAHAIARAHRFPSPTGTVSIIHRDLKPENIFITTQDGADRLKILDYGIAQAKSLAELAVGRVTTSEQLNAFSPAYGAPEQWVPKRFGQTGTWTDVWGLALTMVEALVGRQVIDGEPQAMMGTALDMNRRPTPRSEGVHVTAEVDAVFERALAVNPRDRTRDIDTFWSELEIAMGLAPSLGPRAVPLDDPYAHTPGPPSSSMRAPPVKRVAHVWLEAPASAPMELDLDAAPASIRSSMLGRNPGSVRPPSWSDAAGTEVDLPEGPPPSARARMGSVGAQDSGPASVRPRVGGMDSVPPSGRARPAVQDNGPASVRPRLGVDNGPASVRPRFVGDVAAQAALPATGRMHDMAGAMPLEADLAASPRMPPRTPSIPPTTMRPPPGVELPSPAGLGLRVSAIVTPRPASRGEGAANAETRPVPARTSLARLLAPPVICIVFACGLTVADLIMKSSGPGLNFGSVRSFWVAGVLLLFGVGLFFWRVLGEQGDG